MPFEGAVEDAWDNFYCCKIIVDDFFSLERLETAGPRRGRDGGNTAVLEDSLLKDRWSEQKSSAIYIILQGATKGMAEGELKALYDKATQVMSPIHSDIRSYASDTYVIVVSFVPPACCVAGQHPSA